MGAIATDAIILITYILIILLAAFILWMIIDVRNNVKRIADSLDRLASSESRRNGEAHHQRTEYRLSRWKEAVATADLGNPMHRSHGTSSVLRPVSLASGRCS